MDAILAFLSQNQLFAAIVDIISIIGFIVTIWVLWDVRSLKRHYIFKGRIPQHVESLNRYASSISELMNDFENSIPQVEMTLSYVQVELESLSKKVNRKHRQPINLLVQEIESYIHSGGKNKDDLWRLYIGINKTIQRVSVLVEDLSWEKIQ